MKHISISVIEHISVRSSVPSSFPLHQYTHTNTRHQNITHQMKAHLCIASLVSSAIILRITLIASSCYGRTYGRVVSVHIRRMMCVRWRGLGTVSLCTRLLYIKHKTVETVGPGRMIALRPVTCDHSYTNHNNTKHMRSFSYMYAVYTTYSSGVYSVLCRVVALCVARPGFAPPLSVGNTQTEMRKQKCGAQTHTQTHTEAAYSRGDSINI